MLFNIEFHVNMYFIGENVCQCLDKNVDIFDTLQYCAIVFAYCAHNPFSHSKIFLSHTHTHVHTHTRTHTHAHTHTRTIMFINAFQKAAGLRPIA